MTNIKGFAIGTDGNMKRIAVTYDVVAEDGKVTNANARVNRVVTDAEVLAAIETITDYAESIVEE